MAENDSTTTRPSARNSVTPRDRIDAARQLLDRADELGDRFVIEHALMMLSAAWAGA